MPTERFFNLPDEKKTRILEAAYQEMCRVAFDEVSINKIIQAAEIPRGSFYQYFEDKVDMLEYMLKDYLSMLEHELSQSLAESGGDLFYAVRKLMYSIVEFGCREDNFQFCKNIFGQMRITSDSPLNIANFTGRKMIDQFFDQIDLREFKYPEKDDVIIATELVVGVLGGTIARIFLDFEEKEQLIASFERKLHIIQHGMLMD